MTVQELREELDKYNDDKIVMVGLKRTTNLFQTNQIEEVVQTARGPVINVFVD